MHPKLSKHTINRLTKALIQLIFSLFITVIPMATYADTEKQPTQDTQVYIIHGYMASPSDHWFQWLKEQLNKQGISADLIALPNSSSPDPVAWQNTLGNKIDRLDTDTYFVAHSLGSVALLTNLQQRLSNSSIGGIVLVSGFTSPLPELPQLDAFVSGEIDYKKLIEASGQISVFASPQDPIVPFRLTLETAERLDASFYPVTNAGHFLAEDGYTEFPQLLTHLLEMIEK